MTPTKLQMSLLV